MNIFFMFLSAFIFTSSIAFSQTSYSTEIPPEIAVKLRVFPIKNYEPQLKSELRAPDVWEVVLNVVANDKDTQSSIMKSYREEGYAKLQWANLWNNRCKDVWRLLSDTYHLPISSSYFPLLLSKEENCSCELSGEILLQFDGISDDGVALIERLEKLYDGDDFIGWLHELRIVIRLLENFELDEHKGIWETREKVMKIAPLDNLHKVLKGETLYSLSVLYKVSIESIQEANGLGESTNISEGSSLIIPYGL